MAVVVDDDRCYIVEPVTSECIRERTIITKEAFIQCYKKWILEDPEQYKLHSGAEYGKICKKES